MYKRILVPVDLRKQQEIEKALISATDLAKHYGSELVFAGVTGTAPSSIAHSLDEYRQKLAEFGEATNARLGCNASTVTIHIHDVSIDLDRALVHKAVEICADLIVMASHRPGVAEHIFSSNAGYVAAHAPISVLVVRN